MPLFLSRQLRLTQGFFFRYQRRVEKNAEKLRKT
uniref:Uncharacterized protein n=1 Tax=Siphoviridae sp. ctSP74 TaxID=2826343 RepID=A0A8S5NQS8_9CAUD|nr:MAG TPA: hypothetical protein [Siphoviridae sp. ctSP74]